MLQSARHAAWRISPRATVWKTGHEFDSQSRLVSVRAATVQFSEARACPQRTARTASDKASCILASVGVSILSYSGYRTVCYPVACQIDRSLISACPCEDAVCPVTAVSEFSNHPGFVPSASRPWYLYSHGLSSPVAGSLADPLTARIFTDNTKCTLAEPRAVIGAPQYAAHTKVSAAALVLTPPWPVGRRSSRGG